MKFPIIIDSSNPVPRNDSKPILVVYPISQDLLTSLEVESLRIQTILKYASFEFDLVQHHESNFSPIDKLPCLIVEGEVFAGRDILKYVSAKTDIDASMSKSQYASAFAHIQLAQAKLGMALECALWYETSNFNEITAKQRGGFYPWPLNYLIPRVQRKSMIENILSRKPVIQTNDIYHSAANTLDALSLLLGEHPYFFGSRYLKFYKAYYIRCDCICICS